MNQTILDNWKNSDLNGLRRRLKELKLKKDWYEFKLKNTLDEREVISYYIGLTE